MGVTPAPPWGSGEKKSVLYLFISVLGHWRWVAKPSEARWGSIIVLRAFPLFVSLFCFLLVVVYCRGREGATALLLIV